jgi:hypothetical protein
LGVKLRYISDRIKTNNKLTYFKEDKQNEKNSRILKRK